MTSESHPSRTLANGGLTVTQRKDICGGHREPSAPTLPFGQTAMERPSEHSLLTVLPREQLMDSAFQREQLMPPEDRASSSVLVTTSDYTD